MTVSLQTGLVHLHLAMPAVYFHELPHGRQLLAYPGHALLVGQILLGRQVALGAQGAVSHGGIWHRGSGIHFVPAFVTDLFHFYSGCLLESMIGIFSAVWFEH
jgi:hypothetical protein